MGLFCLYAICYNWCYCHSGMSCLMLLLLCCILTLVILSSHIKFFYGNGRFKMSEFVAICFSLHQLCQKCATALSFIICKNSTYSSLFILGWCDSFVQEGSPPKWVPIPKATNDIKHSHRPSVQSYKESHQRLISWLGKWSWPPITHLQVSYHSIQLLWDVKTQVWLQYSRFKCSHCVIH